MHTYIGTAHNVCGPEALALSREARFEHFGAFGSSGVGKSNLLRHIAAQDIARGDGLLYLDPHGDEAEALLELIPPWRHNHVCYLSLGELDFPVAFNVLERTAPDDRARTADALVAALRDIWFDSMTAAPRMEVILRHAALALLDLPEPSIALIPRLLTDDVWRTEHVLPQITNPVTRAFFSQRFEQWRDAFRAEAIEPVLTRLDAVLSFPSLLNTMGQPRGTLHLEHAMLAGRIVIVNLCKGIAGDTAAALFGAVVLARARSAAMARLRQRPEERRDFHIIVDEIQSIASNTIPSLLAEARKARVSVSYATQMLAGLSDRTRAAMLATTGTVAAFRVGPEDADAIAGKFNRLLGDFNANLLNELDRGEAVVKIGGGDVRRINCEPPPPASGNGHVVRRQSRRHYGRRRDLVERAVARSTKY